MKLKTFLIINAILYSAFGTMSLLFPAQVMSFYGVEPNTAISLLARYSALGSVALGLVPWFSRNMELSQAQKTIIPAMLICNVIGIIVSVSGSLSGTINGGWSLTASYLVFVIGYAWFLFTKSQKN